jgi:ceramide glucosyltransferase
MNHFLVIAFAVLATCSLLVWAAGHLSAQIKSRRKRAPAQHLPPISILKPMKGASDELRISLEALATQDYPHFEILCCAADPDDPALKIAQSVKALHPETPITIISAPPAFGLNPKVRSLVHMQALGAHDWTLVSDADTAPGADYLRGLAAEVSHKNADFVHNLLVGVGEQGSSAALETLQMNLWVAPGVATADLFAAHACVVGKSMLFRRHQFEALGGWHRYKDLLSDDYLVGQDFQRAGLKVALSPYRVRVATSGRSLKDFWKRHIRWAQIRRSLTPGPFFLEPLLVTPLWIAALVLAASWGDATLTLSLAAFATTAVLGRYALDALLIRKLRGSWLKARHWYLMPLRDALVLGAWGYSLCRNTVDWQGNVMRIKRGSRVVPQRPRSTRASSS